MNSFIMSDIYLKEEDTVKAISCYLRAEHDKMIPSYHKELYRSRNKLSEIYEKQNKLHQTIYYTRLINKEAFNLVDLFDKLEIINKQYRVHEVEIKIEKATKQAQLRNERELYWLTLTLLVLGLITVGYRWRKYIGKWKKLKDKYNHFVIKYNEYFANVQAAVAAQRKLNDELSGVLDSNEMRDPREYLWRNSDDEEKDTEK